MSGASCCWTPAAARWLRAWAWTRTLSWSMSSRSSPPPSAPRRDREKFNLAARDVAARGRKCAVWLILATQRPSSQIVDTALRDLFGYRCAFRCTTGTSSDIVLGHGWAANGYDASLIDPLARGVAWLLAEDGLPRRIKVAYLDDGQVAALARRAALLRGRA